MRERWREDASLFAVSTRQEEVMDSKAQHKTKGRVSVLLLLGVLAAVELGCGAQAVIQYAGRRFYREAKGVSSDGFVAEPFPEDMGPYKQFLVEPLGNQMEDKIPAELLAQLSQKFYSHLKMNLATAGEVIQLQGQVVDDPSTLGLLAGLDQPSDNGADETTASTGQPPLVPIAWVSAGTISTGVGTPRRDTLILKGIVVDFDQGSTSQRTLQVGVGRDPVLTLFLWFYDGAGGLRKLGKLIVNSSIYRLTSDSETAVEKLSEEVGLMVADLIRRKSRGGKNATKEG